VLLKTIENSISYIRFDIPTSLPPPYRGAEFHLGYREHCEAILDHVARELD